jgi:hypothetical protein
LGLGHGIRAGKGMNMPVNGQANQSNTFKLPADLVRRAVNFNGRYSTFQRIDEWLREPSPVFLLTGDPGMGKSAVAVRLAQISLGEASSYGCSRLRPGLLVYAHFCRARNEPALNPVRFVESLSSALASRYDPVRAAILRTNQQDIHIYGQATAEVAEAGAQLTGVRVTVNVGDRSPRAAFDQLVRQPLEALSKPDSEQMIVLVDALDEADLWTPAPTIVDLILSATGEGSLPNLRFILTSRSDPDIVERFSGHLHWDLVADAPDDRDDISKYVRDRTHAEAPDADPEMAIRIAEASSGNFLYAELALDYWSAHFREITSIEALHLPPKLDGIYSLFLERDFGSPEGRRDWEKMARPLLAAVGVAQEPLSAEQLRWVLDINEDDLQDLLRRCKQYLSGQPPQGPFAIYHQSFREFLFDMGRHHRFAASAGQWHGHIASRCLERYADQWDLCQDQYALRYVATHLAEAAVRAKQPERHELVERLTRVVWDQSFQRAHDERLDDASAFLRDLELGLASCSLDDHPKAIPLVVEAALGLIRFRRERLDPSYVLALARQGKLDAARKRLQSFPVSPWWQQVVLLICAWLASTTNPADAQAILQQAKQGLDPASEDPLARLARWIEAVVAGHPLHPTTLSPPSPEVAHDLVARLIGAPLISSPSQLAKYISLGPDITVERIETEARDLVSFAADHPDPGDEYVRAYVDYHTANTYYYYRNQAIIGLLSSVLEHPNLEWVKRILADLAAAALVGGRLEFDECTPMALLALKARLAMPYAHADLAQRSAAAQSAARRLRRDRGGDEWSAHKRRLGAIAEAYSVALNSLSDAQKLLELAVALPFGRAGFQSPACLTLAESAFISDASTWHLVRQALQLARVAAHHVLDPTFCAQATSRWNALVGEPWSEPFGPAAHFDVESVAHRFSMNPSATEFAACHIIGESYENRTNHPPLRLPPAFLKANTLTDLADRVYKCQLVDLARLNRHEDWEVDQPLPAGTIVRIPDPGLAPLLAARLSAMTLADPNIPPSRRTSIVQRMVPLATSNPTALDTVLGRLLLVALPQDPRSLEKLPDLLDSPSHA